MGKCGQTMNAKRKHKNKQRKENSRALKLRKNGVLKNRAELARVSGVALCVTAVPGSDAP